MNSKIILEIPSAEYKKWKTIAIMLMKPNKVTEKALKQSKSGKNLKKFNSLEALFENLSI